MIVRDLGSIGNRIKIVETPPTVANAKSGVLYLVEHEDGLCQGYYLDESDGRQVVKLAPSAMMGKPEGIATLDANGKIPIDQMPTQTMRLIGTWDCSSGKFPSTTGMKDGDYYRVSVGGTLTENRDDIEVPEDYGFSEFEVQLINHAISQGCEIYVDSEGVAKKVTSVSSTKVNFSGGYIRLPRKGGVRLYTSTPFPFQWDFDVGDFILFNAMGEWQKLDNNDAVQSVNGMTGDVTVNGDNIKVTYEGASDTINNIMPLLGKVKTIDGNGPDEDGNINSRVVLEENSLPENPENRIYNVTPSAEEFTFGIDDFVEEGGVFRASKILPYNGVKLGGFITVTIADVPKKIQLRKLYEAIEVIKLETTTVTIRPETSAFVVSVESNETQSISGKVEYPMVIYSKNVMLAKKDDMTGDGVTATYEGVTDTLNNLFPMLGKVKSVNSQSPNDSGDIQTDIELTQAEYDALERKDPKVNYFISDGDVVPEMLKELIKSLSADLIKKAFEKELPAGYVASYMGTSAPDGWLMCDDTDYSADAYPRLWEILPDAVKNLESRTFKIDMRDRVPQGANDNLGEYKEAGLPNITGNMNAYAWEDGSVLGAFKSKISSIKQTAQGSDSGRTYVKFDFDASKGETKTDGTLKTSSDYKVYGKSDTVQPAALCLNYIIKY